MIKIERRGGYLGITVQVIPHVTDRIKEFIKKDITNDDFVIVKLVEQLVILRVYHF